MKTPILDKILSNETLDTAYQQVYKNKGMAGVDKMTVFELKNYLRKNSEKLKILIRSGQYKPQPILRFDKRKIDVGVRQISIPTVVDRLIQQAIYQVISPIFEIQFHENSFGYRPNRSCEMAAMKSLEILNTGYT